MLEHLFGSKTRVMLLRLFLNNPEKFYFVRELTRNLDSHLNSIRRELSNLQQIGIIDFYTKSDLEKELERKIKDNKKIQNILLYGGIILAILIFILALVGRWMYERTDWTVR